MEGATGVRSRLAVPPWLLDAGLATALVIVGLATAARDDRSAGVFRDRDALAVALILVSTAPYYLRRRLPLTVLTVATSGVVVLMLRGYQPGALPFSVLVGAYTVGAERPPRAALSGAAVLAALLGALAVGGAPEFGAAELVSSGTAFGGALLLGQTLRARTARIDALAQQQHEAALRAATDERLRIAQEMHDVVAHSLGVIAVQAGVGMHVIGTDPAEARRALENISRTSRSSLAEIRMLLGLVRGTTGAPAYTPAPGLSDIAQLATDVTDAGLHVDVTVEGDAEPHRRVPRVCVPERVAQCTRPPSPQGWGLLDDPVRRERRRARAADRGGRRRTRRRRQPHRRTRARRHAGAR